MLRKTFLAIGLFLILAGWVSPVQAVTTTAQGYIWDMTHGIPLAGAEIVVNAPPNSTVSNAMGAYTLVDMDLPPADPVHLMVMMIGYAPYSNLNETRIKPGESNVRNVGVYVGSLISGRVIDYDTLLPLAGVTITVKSADYPSEYQVNNHQMDGSYKLRQPPGWSRVYAEAENYAPSLTVWHKLKDEKDYPNKDFSLYIGGSISGRVFYGYTTATAAGVEVIATLSGSQDYMPRSVTFTAADGSYILSHVYPSFTDVLVIAPPGWANDYRSGILVLDKQLKPNIDFHLRGGGELLGLVADYTGAPVNFAEVTCFPADGNTSNQQSTRTSLGGTYNFQGLVVGKYALRVKPMQGSNLQIEQISGVEIVSLGTVIRNFTLQPGGIVSGYIHGVGGNTLTGAGLGVFIDLQYPFDYLIGVQTDTAGYFQVDGLSPFQNYTLGVDPALANTINAVGVVKGLTVAEGETRTWNFTLSLGGGREGRVLDFAGQPVLSGTTIAFNTQLGSSFDIAGGDYKLIGLPVGDYLGFIQPGMDLGNLQMILVKFTVTPGLIETVDYQLPEGGVLRGFVYRNESGGNTSTAGNVMVRAYNKRDPGSSFLPVETLSYTDGVGYYEIKGLSSGTCQIDVLPGAQDGLGWSGPSTSMTFTAGEEHQADFYITQNAWKVYGTVRDQFGNRIVNGLVFFWTSGGFHAAAGTDNWGNYALMLPPGAYQAQAFYTSQLGTNLAVNQVSDLIVSDQSRQQEFVMEKGGTVSGVISDQAGNPIRLGLVRAYPQDENNPLPVRLALTGVDGAFAIKGLHSASYCLEVEAEGYSPARGTFSATLGGETGNMNMVLVAQTSIAGTVTGKNNLPVTEAWVAARDAQGIVQLQIPVVNNAFVLEPLSGGPFAVQVKATGFKPQTRSGVYPGSRADFVLEPLIGKGEAISYPNPARGNLITFLFWLEEDATALIRVYNQTGELVWDWEGPAFGRQYNRHRWQVGGVAPGVYLFKVTARKADGTVERFPTGKLTVIK